MPKGQTAWNKGKKGIFSDECLMRISESHKKLKHHSGRFKKGHTPSIETRQKISKSRIGIFAGSNHPRWRGGRRHSDGYILIVKPGHPFCDKLKKCVYEHRLVVEKIIGRYLIPEEQVHHVGERDDNRPHMLMCFSSQSAHQRFHKDPLNVKPEEIIFDGRKL